MAKEGFGYKRDQRIGIMAEDKATKIFERNGLKPKRVGLKEYEIVLGDGTKVQVKFDTWIAQTGNLSCEWWSNKPSEKPGWAQYCEADILVYFYNFDNAYVLDMPKLKEYIQEHFSEFEAKKGVKHYEKSGVVNIMVPIKEVEHLRIKKYEGMFF